MVPQKLRRLLSISVGLFIAINFFLAKVSGSAYGYYYQTQNTKSDSLRIKEDSLNNLQYNPSRLPTFQQRDRFGDPFSNFTSPSPLLLSDPASLKLDLEMDSSNNYTIYEKIGEINYRPTSTITFDEFNRYQTNKLLKEYWKTKSESLDGESAVSGRNLIPPIYVSPVFDRLFGGSYVELEPRGFVTLDFGGKWQRIDNPAIPVRQQRSGGFEFDQQISMNVVGKVGEKLQVTANYDNNNSFDFENNLKVEYTGYEEDIIKKLEIGNVSLPLNNSLISGAQNLFGLKTQLQFGKLFVTAVASTQRGKTDALEIESGGVQKRDFELRASDYDENRHFFLSHFFRQNYERWLSQIPQVSSGLNVTRVEVYVLNKNSTTQSLRNIVALMDLGEGFRVRRDAGGLPLPVVEPLGGINSPAANNSNGLFLNITDPQISRSSDLIKETLENQFNLINSTDFEVVNSARLLDPSEYFIHPQLGYISLYRKLQNDEVLAVAYEYTYNGRPFKVGELREDYTARPENEVAYLKLLRPRKINIRDQFNKIIPTWDLMMKNIYSLNSNQISKEGFQFRIIYRDDRTGIDNPSLHEGIETKDVPLIGLLGLDKLNPSNDPPPDGNFDYVEGLTINPVSGLIIFPVLEPFGEHLRKIFERNNEQDLIQKYAFDTLYATTKADAELQAERNKFFLKGSFQAGSSSEIILPGINIAEGSVRVLSGNTPLQEGIDYTVDYNFGKVTIINEGVVNSGNRLKITYEKADLFNFQSRTLLGTRMDYRVSNDINFGGTILYLNERPLISRISIGDEPTRNMKYGFDVNVRKDSRLITKMVDALPFLQTKELSAVTFSGEFAQIVPGTSNIVDGEGTSYVDDFEGIATPFHLGNTHQAWAIASTPVTPDNKFDPSGNMRNDLSFGYKRAKIAWHVIDNVFYRSGRSLRPDNIGDQELSNHYVRGVRPQEIFPARDNEIITGFEGIFDIAYFPTERGPYNFNPSFISSDPKSNWGGITRPVTSEVDFDKSNTEYLEFWLLDPFIDGTNGRVLDGSLNTNNTTGGELIFNLGSISEDVLKDGKHAFENGLPADGSLNNVTQNVWGRVTDATYLNDAFDNSAGARVNQDVGLDGLKNADEQALYPDFSALADPAADDFRHYLDPSFDQLDAKILERYKDFNGLEGNTPLSSTFSNSQFPDNEDLDSDNTLNDLEEYYEYSVSLNPGQLTIGSKYIVDAVTSNVDLPNGSRETVTWYLFRIPVRNFDRKIGNIQGFKSIRFVRTYLTGWEQPVVLRMSKFRLIGSQWRRYTRSLEENRFDQLPETDFTDFTVSVVNIEENSQGGGVNSPYTLPPGFRRDRDNTSVIERNLNEQSMRLCVEDLSDKDARAVFKNVDIDLINYGSIKMFIHAESDNAVDDEITGFLRLGTDFTENYYEIEVPLKITPADVSTNDPNIQRLVWPLENEINIDLDLLYQLKARRNRTRNPDEFGFRYSEPYTDGLRNYNITIVGRPELSTILGLMIGVRNPGSPDRSSKSVCIWANELRVSDFDRKAGWAANANVNVKLADLGTISGSTRYTTPGFGGVQTKISERERKETLEWDIATNLALDKLLPRGTGLKIPMYASYQQSVITPEFDPKDPDIPLEQTLATISNTEEERNYKNIVQDKGTRRSLNFTGIRKTRNNPESRSDFWDIENFSFTYAYSDFKRSDFNIESYLLKNQRGSIDYNYAYDPLYIEPFKNVKFLNSPHLKLLKDINLNLLPNSFGLRGELDRRFIKTQYRNENLDIGSIEPTYEKSFFFNRNYTLGWNLTKAISLNYTARTNAIIDEPEGDIETQEEKDEIWDNILDLGRTKTFTQNVNASYKLPFDKLPLIDWVSADYQYTAGYIWTAGSVNLRDSLGNIIRNDRTNNVSGKLDFLKLYNKNKFLKDINSPVKRPVDPKADTVQRPNFGALKGVLRLIMSLRSINMTYSLNESTILPGFLPEPSYFGQDDGLSAPGWGFVFGSQDNEIKRRAVENNWLAQGTGLTNPFTQRQTIDIGLRATLEPFNDFKIQLDAKKTKSSTFQEIFRYDEDSLTFRSLNPTRSGTFSISYISINTAFKKDRSDNSSPLFDDYIAYREVIRQRLNDLNSSGEYNLNSQDVLIPAFIAAYSGKSAEEIKLSPFPGTPLPNWRVDYNGLSKVEALKDIFSSVTLTHAYNSTYSINSFTNSLLYEEGVGLDKDIEDYPLASIVNENGELVPIYIINQVVITERFSPLIGLNVRTRSRLTAKIDYKIERTMTLNLSNTQITEIKSNDIGFDFGYTTSNFTLPFRVQGRTVALKNDLTFRMNFSVRDTRTHQRRIEEGSTITNGNVNFQLRPNINYVLNQRLSLQVYFERNINEPKVTNSFKRATTAFGVQIRFSLAQ
ncbi:MAG TPA: cell surface protein SprA [Cyclobacteriaceae bacterium]